MSFTLQTVNNIRKMCTRAFIMFLLETGDMVQSGIGLKDYSMWGIDN